MRALHHGNKIIRVTRDDSASEILEDFEQQHPMPGATREDARRRKLIGSLPADRFDVQRDGALWRVWDSGPDDEPAAGMNPGSALAAALKNASRDAATRTDDADDRRTREDTSLPMPQRLAAWARINARRRHDLR
jgi:hypothetical protein